MYHLQYSPLPREPPVKLRVLEAPWHIVDGFDEAEVAAVDGPFTVTVVLRHVVVLQYPIALTQNVVVELRVGIIVVPTVEARYVPPQEPVYQYQQALVPRLPPLIVIVDVPPVQIPPGVVVIEPGNVELEFILMNNVDEGPFPQAFDGVTVIHP